MRILNGSISIRHGVRFCHLWKGGGGGRANSSFQLFLMMAEISMRNTYEEGAGQSPTLCEAVLICCCFFSGCT